MRWSNNARRVWIGGASLVTLSVVAAGVMLIEHGRLRGATSSPAAASKPDSAPDSPASSGRMPTSVTLTPEKLKAANLRFETARSVTLPAEVTVSGRIEPNVDRRIDIRSRAPGVIRSVSAQIGQQVKAGELLVTLDSPDVGTARLNLRNRQRDLAIAHTEAEWRRTIAANVEQLVPELRKRVPAQALEQQFADRPLGTDRGLLLAAYAEWEIARHEEEKQNEYNKKGITGEHPLYLAKHTREGAQAKFEAAIEQVRHDAEYERRIGDQQERVARASVIDAAQRLRLLGITVDVAQAVAQADKALGDTQTGDNDDVTAYPIIAPFDGTIIVRSAVPSQRAELNDVLFTLADLRRVRVMANIPEAEFDVLPGLTAGTVRVTATAYPGRVFEANVMTVGAVVDQTTRSVPLLAETSNADGLLKLGMFVRVALDSPRQETVVTVPDGTVVEIEGKAGVFVPRADGRTFDFHPVTLGRQVQGRQAITSGLAAGQRIVSGSGGFLLKSELILQNEADED